MLERANNLYDVFKNATGEKIDDGLFREYDGFDNLSEAFDAMSEADSWIDDTRKKLSGMTDDIARAGEQTAKYHETATTVADAYAEMFKLDSQNDDSVAMADDIDAMAAAIQAAGLNASTYAQQTALARAGQGCYPAALERRKGLHSASDEAYNAQYGHTALRRGKKQFGRVYRRFGRLDALHKNARRNRHEGA